MPTPPDPAPPPDSEPPGTPMPTRVPPAAVSLLLDHTTAPIGADVAAALLDAVRDIHAACDAHRSHGNRSVPVVDLDLILGRHLRPHLTPADRIEPPRPESTPAPPTP